MRIIRLRYGKLSVPYGQWAWGYPVDNLLISHNNYVVVDKLWISFALIVKCSALGVLLPTAFGQQAKLVESLLLSANKIPKWLRHLDSMAPIHLTKLDGWSIPSLCEQS